MKSIITLGLSAAAAYSGNKNLAALTICAYVIYRVVRFVRSDCDVTLDGLNVKASAIKGKVVWVTGASSGIGEALAEELSKYGAQVVISARRVADLERVAKQCASSYPAAPPVTVVPMDLVDEASRTKSIEAVFAKHGRVDILVNNAGVSQRALALDVQEKVERQLFEINYFGTVALTKAVALRMRSSGGGRVVLVSSVAGKFAAPASASYCATKHAVQGFFGAMRIEEAPNNIGVTVICPGPVVSDVARNALGADGAALGPREGENAGKMPTERCAQLSVIAISQGLDECWISRNPFLFYTYLAVYCPWTFTKMSKTMGQKRVNAHKAGKELYSN